MLKVNLWEVRTAKGLKLEAVAVMTGVSKSTLNNIENGKTSPTLANLEKIAKGLGCRISDLYDSEYNRKWRVALLRVKRKCICERISNLEK